MTVKPFSPPPLVPDTQSAWHDAVMRLSTHYGIGASAEKLRIEAGWTPGARALERLARSAGLEIEEIAGGARGISELRLPLLASFDDQTTGVIESVTTAGFMVAFSGDGGLGTEVPHEVLATRIRRLFVARPAAQRSDTRIDSIIAPIPADWLKSIVLADLKPYRAVFTASLMANVLTLAGIIFSMQVYDRVVPSQSLPTLYVLFGGVMLATLFGYLIRMARMRISESAGKAADLKISERVFSHALAVQSTARPRATGTFIGQIRELEQVREMMTSTTVSAVADLPFFLLFCALFFYIAGPLVWIPLVAVVLLILPGMMAQKRLRRLAEASSRESALRSAMLVEAVQGLDDIKSLQAEPRFRNLWNHYNEVTAGSGMRLREVVNALSTWSQTVQGAVFAFVVFFGAPLVMAGDMSTGVLVAASMLSSRMIAPLASVTQLLNRWQQARVARAALDKLMALPVDAPRLETRIHKPLIHGRLALKNASFGHNPDQPVLKVAKLEIAPGERIAVLGRNGSGKSTLLSGLSGLLAPQSGEIRVDDVTMTLVDPADIRRDICLMGQGARLFHGTIRENMRLGAPRADDAAILDILDRLGLSDFIARLPEGLDHPIQEGGLGLSGGQRQGLLLARTLLRAPRLLLLDEPTAALDDMAENAAINLLAALPPETGVIIATHRPAILRMVDRLIVVSNGAVVMDGAKEDVLARLRKGSKAVAA